MICAVCKSDLYRRPEDQTHEKEDRGGLAQECGEWERHRSS
jgi:hypothetical protein